MRRPRFIAEHARHAKGLLGRLIAFIMARETWRQNLRVMDALRIEQADHVLDIGCGHGRSLTDLAARAPRGHIVGVDPSELMVEIAAQRNRSLIEAARVDIVLSTVESLPFPDGVFDRAQCVHVVYFWKDIGTSLREIARVLKPGGPQLPMRNNSAEANLLIKSSRELDTPDLHIWNIEGPYLSSRQGSFATGAERSEKAAPSGRSVGFEMRANRHARAPCDPQCHRLPRQ